MEVRLMSDAVMTEVRDAEESSDILQEVTLRFEENLVVQDSDCPDYGCTCISHEKCCGCFLQ